MFCGPDDLFNRRTKVDFAAKKFKELNTKELYEILRARAEIFVMEQNINYQDMDGTDYKSLHCFFSENDKVTAYLRAYYQNENTDEVKIGRVLTLRHGGGLGRKLMEESLAAIIDKMPCSKMCMDAQKHAVGFYEKFGFRAVSGEFMEEGIVHIAMELNVIKTGLY